MEEVLSRFGDKVGAARKAYTAFVAARIGQGRRDELVGGGLRRSLAFLGRTKERESYDERILGSGRFVEALWKEEELREKLGPQLNLLELVERVSEAMGVPVQTVLRRSRNADATTARQVVCHVATRILGARGTEVGELLGMGQSGASRSARLGRARWDEDEALRRAVLGEGV